MGIRGLFEASGEGWRKIRNLILPTPKTSTMSLSCQNLLLAAGLTFAAAAHGQSSIDALAGKFVTYVRADRKEKVIVVTDKSFYVAGESIWLKGWCLDSLSNRFIYLSKTMIVDLVDDKDSVIGQLLFNISARKTAGRIVLPATLAEGNYWLRAYTTRIVGQDSNRIFVKPIYVVNPNKPNPDILKTYANKSTAGEAAPDAPDTPDTSAPQMIFYPEGGAIISGTTATVAFRSVSANGQPAEVSGFVTDPLHDTVSRFRSAAGMGKFRFDAFNPRKYTAHIAWNGREVLYPLPAIDQFASQLTIVGQDERMLKMQVSLGDSLYKKHKVTRILGMSRDSLCFAAEGTDMYQVNVPLVSFPLGRACFVLFDDQGNIASQRSVYIRNSDSGRIVAATDKTDYSPGDNVNLRIGVKAPDNIPVITILSISVTDDRLTGNRGAAQDVARGLPETEEAQFRDYSPAALDVLMMTAAPLYTGWGKAPAGGAGRVAARFADSTLLYIRGKAVGKNNLSLQREVVNLVAADKGLFLTDTTDKDGRFVFPLSEYDDGARFYIKLTKINGNGAGGKLVLDKADIPKFHTPQALKRGYSSEELAMVRRYKRIQDAMKQLVEKASDTLKPATVVDRKKLPPEDEAQRVSLFSDIIAPDQLKTGGVDMIYHALLNIPGFTTGVNRTLSGRANAPLVLVDGIQAGGGNLKSFFESFDESNVEFIEVLKGPLTAIYGMQGAAGVILIHSRNHGQDVAQQDVAQVNEKGLATISPRGYCCQPDVFASGYDNTKGVQGAGMGYAPTLYWNANLLTDTQGNAQVDFSTALRRATYSAAIVGFTPGAGIVAKTIQIICR
jgi:hypothetical protein